MKFSTWALGLMVALMGAMSHGWLAGQSGSAQQPQFVILSTSGRDLFEFYCASCHGRDAKGNGPVAAALKMPPSDLTAIAQRSGGTFSKARVEAFVTGESRVPAHGSTEMPVWGPIFRGLDTRDAMNKVRIANIVGYIESIQEPAATSGKKVGSRRP